MNSTLRIQSLAWILVAALLHVSSNAAPIAIGDPSFEGNTFGAGGWSNNIGPEWTGTSGQNNGNAFEEYATNITAADGTDQLGMVLDYDVWQDLGVTYQPNSRYTLTVAAGNRSGYTNSGNQTQYLLADASGTVHATGTYDAYANVTPGSFANAPALVFDTPNDPTAVGQTIRVLLRARGAGRSHFDNIRLDAVSLIPAGGATVAVLPATAITASGATLNGHVTDIGNGAPTITFFWGATQGNMIPATWQNSFTLSGTQTGAFSTAIAGFAPNTTIYFTARASNSAGESWAAASGSFETPPLPPSIANATATSIRATSATLAAQVTDTGGEPPAVTVFYGTNDGGTTPANWAASAVIGNITNSGSVGISGLTHATPYFFRAFAQNSGGSAWAAETATFSTLAALPAAIINDTATGITGTTATLRGEVTADGNDSPVVTIFYGTADGGTNAASWSHSALVGTDSGNFTRFVSGLTVNTNYFFRCRAVNAGGTAWAPDSATFTTTALVSSAPVINEIHYHPADDATLGPLPLEFIELYNPGDTAVDLSGWSLANAVTFSLPAGTTLGAGGYLVIAQNPSTLLSKYGVSALGPWIGKLASTGETIELRDTANLLKDTVSYQSGFPWPTSADGAGLSMELINPSLDNDVGGSWRASGFAGIAAATYISPSSPGWKYKRGTAEASSPVDAWRQPGYDDSTGWTTAPAAFGYGGSYTVATAINNASTGGPMRNVHRSVYYRKTFTIASALPEQLTFTIKYDDGFVAWINGVEIKRANAPGGQVPYNVTSGASLSGHPATAWESFTINTVINGVNILKGGTNVLCVHSLNESLGSSDYFFDAELGFAGTGSSTAPTPGTANIVRLATNLIPPQIRQVTHSPNQPAANVPVTITARITDPDGMGAVSLLYQTVDPGSYIPLKTVNTGTKLQEANPAYLTGWTSVPMVDNGTSGDAVAGDFMFTAVMPASLQTNRRLVRYKIAFQDSIGNTQSVPYADDEQPNFAYFVYNGVPAWTGAIRPSAFNGNTATAAVTYPAETLNSLPPYHFIARAADVTNSQYNGTYDGIRFRGTLVYDGVVYDHVDFKNRGIGSTYQSGKNKWNIMFNRSRDLVPRDNWGGKYKETWNNLILNANASPWAPLNRGSAGIEEAASARIFELAGNTNFRTHYVHWRVIDSAAEASPSDQFTGDLWGLYIALEPTEGNFLDERGLSDGSIYSIEGNTNDKKHQGEGQPVDSSDCISFRSNLATSGQTEAWYRANMDLDKLFTFMAINRLIGNVDVRPDNNYRYYHRTSDNKWEILAYDLDMQFIAAHHWGGYMDGVVVAGQPNSILAIMRHPALALEYRNRCRELMDLLGSDGTANGGQIGQLLDEYAAMVHPAGQTATWANLDAAMWNLNPYTRDWSGDNSGQSSHTGNFFRATYYDPRGAGGGTIATSSWIRSLPDPDGDGFSDFPGRVQWFVDFATNTYPTGAAPWVRKATLTAGGGHDPDINRQKGYGFKYLEWESLYGGYADSRNEPTQAADTNFPNTPTITSSGSPGYPSNDVRFTTTAFTDPNGNGTFGALQWRIAEISAPGIAGHVAGTPRKYEVETTWESGDLTSFKPEFQMPVAYLKPGSTYRARVRHKDSSLRYSHWSAPIQFTVSAPDVTVWQNNLMISEIMYNPAVPTPAEIAAGGTNFNNDYEFIELRNISSTLTLDLTELRFTKGVDFDFEGSSITSLPPGAFVLVVKNLASFQARYGTSLPVAGVWDAADNLSNSGEEIKLSYGAGTAIHHINPTGMVRYDQAPWPITPDGSGPSLTLTSPTAAPNHDIATNWRASYINNGSPGTVDNLVNITLENLSHVYDGFAKAATITTNPAGVGVSLTYNGSVTRPADGGSYAVLATVSDSAFEGSSTATLTIAPASQTLTFAPPSTIPYDGLPLVLNATSSSGLPASFTLVSGPATLSGSNLTPTGAGIVVVRASQAGNGNYQAAPNVDATITVTSDYQQSVWKQQHFTPIELADPAVSGPLADADGDGFPNLVEFSMNLDPKTSNRQLGLCVYQEVTVSGQRYPAMTIRRRITYPGLTSHVEASTDLTNWSSPTTLEEGDPTDNGDGTETVQFRSALPLSSQNRQWLRLRVTE